MTRQTFCLAFAAGLLAAAPLSAQSSQDIARWKAEAAAVTIVRDDWGIAHVHGHTDAQAVFGMEYAQAEDDFNRVETNYLDALGWHARADGESRVWSDLRQQLFIDTDSLKAEYARSPDWLKALMDAFADGLNYYLYTHPDVKPKAIAHFEPWMALSFTEGSIGGDIERVNLRDLAAFYTNGPGAAASGASELPPLPGAPAAPPVWTEPTGSNGVAISPKNTLDHHAILYINPHTSFYFRSELQMSSDEGLDAYGAVTWGQFFVYQGFNTGIGWMHTSTGADNIDEFLETISKRGAGYVYKHGNQELPVRTRQVVISYKTPGGMKSRTFTAYYTMHGPVERSVGDKWVTISLMQNHINALIQSYGRTKATTYAAFRKYFDLHTNSSNNTIFADAQGDIAYFHSNYIPNRDTSFDWTQPVDGSNPATDYHGLLAVDSTPNLLNPPSGWLYNSNNWPWSAAGPGDSPNRSDYPVYVDNGREESPRGYHALRVLPMHHDYTMLSLTATMFDSYLPSFAHMIPSLIRAYDAAPDGDTLKTRVAKQIQVLRAWDYRFGINSVATSLANFWGEDVQRVVGREARAAGMSAEDYVADRATPQELLSSLASASDQIQQDFGNWQTPWGDINRFQRFNDDIDSRFDDTKPSIPVAFASSRWGSLASFGARPYPNTKKWYGSSGNSFVAVVEFGPDSVRARAVTAGGESGDPASPHFNDEAVRYSTGNLRVVYYYPSQLVGHTERTYHPGGQNAPSGQGASDPAREASRLDADGQTVQARVIWQALIDSAKTPAERANAQRSMAMSYAFAGDCANTIKYEQMVIDYWKTRETAEPQNAFYQEGEMADEGARVCIDLGDLDVAEKWYRAGYAYGIEEPEPKTHPVSLWDYRLAHALGRLAARRGDKAGAARQVALARKALDSDSAMAAQQERFFPYLVGYVALYTGDLKTAQAEFTKMMAVSGNQRDPFMHYLMGLTYEKLGDQTMANEHYKGAYELATAHNPPAAFVRHAVREKLKLKQ